MKYFDSKGALGRFEFFDERAMKCYDAYGRINMAAKVILHIFNIYTSTES